MYARVVRFTDVGPDHIAARLADAEAARGRPWTSRPRAYRFSTTRTADTPGTRASIDRCEIKAELGSG